MKMTDYAEEQSNELEALESIYPDSFTGVDLRGSLFSGLMGCACYSYECV